jgi:hypothetical protein
MPAGRFTLKAFNTFIGVAVVTICLTVLFLCARAVMDVGGACASGGPYVVAQPCPKGVGWMTPVSILLGLVGVGWYLAWRSGLSGPAWGMLAWPALFLSLGWNFWEYGLDPPGGDGADAGWIVCGVVFVLMGGLPLLAFRSKDIRRAVFWEDAKPETGGATALRPMARTVVRAATPKFTVHRSSNPNGSPPPPRPPGFTATGGDSSTAMVAELQHLAAMHRDGALTDEEFALAKQRILREP